MKTTLVILLIAIGGYAAWLQNSTKSEISQLTTAAEKFESDAKNGAEALKKAEKTIASQSAEIEKLLKTAQVATAETIAPSAPTAAPTAAPAPVVTPAESNANQLQPRLDELQRIYEGHRTKFDEQRATLTRNLAAAKAQHEALVANPPQFSEQSDRYDTQGNRVGSSGVRTSKADREREMVKYKEQVAQVAALIGSAEAALAQIEADTDRLQRDYKNAVETARSVVQK